MSIGSPTVSVLLTVASAASAASEGPEDPDLDDEERDEFAAQLGRALRELPDAAVAAPDSGPAPDGSKGVSALLGALSVTVAASRKALGAVIEVVRHWVALEASRKVLLELDGDKLEITGATTEQLDRLVTAFVDRHGTPKP